MTDLNDRPRSSQWFVLRTHCGQESRAQANLSEGGIESFLPRVRHSGRKVRAPEALFPQYLFARFDPITSLHDVTFTRGVQSVIRVGGWLATVDDNVIEFFRARLDDMGLLSLGQEVAAGERVTIERGPFAQLAGIVERNLPGRQRAIVLLASVSSHLRVEIPTAHLRADHVDVAS